MGTRDGKDLLVTVDLAQIRASAHSDLSCVSCHQDLASTSPDAVSLHDPDPHEVLCGGCHDAERNDHGAGVHGRGSHQRHAAQCRDCHGTHGVLPSTRSDSSVDALRIVETCSRCHSHMGIAALSGVNRSVVATYRESVHGFGEKYGSASVPNCVSCHEFHDIRSVRDPLSPIHVDRIRGTCGKAGCHVGATERFARGTVHVSIRRPDQPLLIIIRYFYLLVIGLVAVAMVAHNILDAAGRLRDRWRALKASRAALNSSSDARSHEPAGPSRFHRMSLNHRVQHVVLVILFCLLAATGFALLLPESGLAVLGPHGADVFHVMGIVHRVAGAMMVAVGVYHAWLMLFTEQGRRDFRDLRFHAKPELGHLLHTVLRGLGRRSGPPAMDRFTYKEKFEYWALLWGAAVMAVTGMVLWSASFWPKLAGDACRSVHYYEAILAVLSLAVWHFYNVHLRPGLFPMSRCWIDGSISREEMEEEHLAEMQRMMAAEGAASEAGSRGSDRPPGDPASGE